MTNITKDVRSRGGQLIASAMLVALFLVPTKAGADFFYSFNNAYTGAIPGGSDPWLTEQFHDVSPGIVDLTISASGLAPGEFVSGIYLNLNPIDSPTKLVFTKLSSTGIFANPSISEGVNGFKAGGDGKYDVLFAFATARSKEFGAGDSITYQITGIPGLTAADFQYLNASSSGAGPFFSAAHVQGITGGLSAWVDPGPLTLVPEPAPFALAGLAFVLWICSRSRESFFLTNKS